MLSYYFMFDIFFPDKIMESAYEIDYEALFDEGIRGIIFDIDNTLVMHGYPADERAIELINRLKSIGFDILLLSNNKEDRVKMFNDDVHVKYIYKAHKPSRAGYMRAVKMLGTDRKSTVFIGDQLFTDVYGAKRAGIRNILVKPIDKHEEIQIIFKRKLEKIVLYFYAKSMKA